MDEKKGKIKMNSKKQRKQTLIFLNALTNSLGDSEGQTVEEVKAELREEGIDIEVELNILKHTIMLIRYESFLKSMGDIFERLLTVFLDYGEKGSRDEMNVILYDMNICIQEIQEEKKVDNHYPFPDEDDE